MSKKIILITYEECGHCHDFLGTVWPDLSKSLSKEGWTVQHENIPSNEKGVWAKNHPDIKPYVSWYPTLLKCRSSKEPIVYGAMAPGKNPRYDYKSTFTAENILKWSKH